MVVQTDISYAAGAACRADLYQPAGKDFPLVVYFHGGGMEGGDKAEENIRAIARCAAERGVGFLSVNYTLYPHTKFPQCLREGAKAVAFAFKNLAAWGASSVYVSGQSAGAYIAMMLCFDARYLQSEGVDPLSVRGWLIESAQQTAHFNVLRECGKDPRLQRIDETAPLYFVSEELRFTRLRLLCYDEDLACRRRQNELLYEAVLQFQPAAELSLEVLHGGHCRASTEAEGGVYPFAEMLCSFVKEETHG